jgi:HEPN domain-containing protein
VIKTTSDDFFDKAMAFLEIAIISSKEKGNSYFNTPEYSNVTAYLVYHATELFLKSAIFKASEKLTKGHDVFKLYEKYKTYYKDEKLNIKIPFSKPENINYCGYTDDEIIEIKEKYSMSFEQQLKYPIDDKGVTYNLITKYDTEFLSNYKKELLELYLKIKES